METQDAIVGGFSKWPQNTPGKHHNKGPGSLSSICNEVCLRLIKTPYLIYHLDPLHAYFGICGLSLMGEPNVSKMNAALNMSLQANEHLKVRYTSIIYFVFYIIG